MRLTRMAIAVHQACQDIGAAWNREQIRLQYLAEKEGHRTMKTFARVKTVEEVRKQCIERGFALNTDRFDKDGWDHISVMLPGAKGEPVEVLYNTFNGRFFHAPKDNPANYFSSDDGGMDGKPWFDAMLNFFYSEEPLTATTTAAGAAHD